MVSSDAAWRAVRQRICRSISVYLHGVYLGSCPLSRIFLGTIVTLMEPPFLSSRIGLTISAPVLSLSDAKHCSRSRKRLQPFLQTFASVIVNVCGKSLHLASILASTCNRPRKYVQPSPQVRASERDGALLTAPCRVSPSGSVRCNSPHTVPPLRAYRSRGVVRLVLRLRVPGQ